MAWAGGTIKRCLKPVGFVYTQKLRDWKSQGFQGIDKVLAFSHTPKKKPRGGKLSAQDKQYNRALAKRSRRDRACQLFSESLQNPFGALPQSSPSIWTAMQRRLQHSTTMNSLWLRDFGERPTL